MEYILSDVESVVRNSIVQELPFLRNVSLSIKACLSNVWIERYAIVIIVSLGGSVMNASINRQNGNSLEIKKIWNRVFCKAYLKCKFFYAIGRTHSQCIGSLYHGKTCEKCKTCPIWYDEEKETRRDLARLRR